MLITCDKTGIQFETDSKRQKNHPAVSALLNQAAKDGVYNAAIEALAEVKSSGGYTIDEALALARSRMTESENEKWQRVRATEIARKAQADARAERRYQNDVLRKHGYTWHKEDEESMDVFGATAFEDRYGDNVSSVWILTAPDGREVTVQQALAEINAK